MSSALNNDANLADMVRAAYGSLEQPDHSFIEKAYKRMLRHPIIPALMCRYFVKDGTDLNDHAALHLTILHDDGSLLLCLSFVDHLAMLFRLAPDSRLLSNVIASRNDAVSDDESNVLSLLAKHGFRLLTKAEASTPVDIQLFNTDSSETMVYHAVIADEGIVPQILRP